MKLADNMPEDSRWTPAVRWVAHNLSVFPNAGQAFVYQIKHNFRGHPCDTCSASGIPRSVWYYFPVAADHQADTRDAGAARRDCSSARPRSLLTPIGLAPCCCCCSA